MTDLHFEDFTIRGHRVGKASWLPAVRELIKSEISAEPDEDDRLFKRANQDNKNRTPL